MAQKQKNVNGILFVDKNEDWTSHDAVAKTRGVLGIRKVGHAGTLDPMATGLLTLGAGPATRLLTHMVGLDKTYTATMRIGEATLSDDRMSEVTESAPEGVVEALEKAQIASAIADLTGDIEQQPSQVSAIKVDGKRSYDRVRKGETVELKLRPVTIHEFVLHGIHEAKGLNGQLVLDLEVTVRCSSGTYIRALARDLGGALGAGGHLTALRRTAVGPFCLADHEALTQDPVVAVTTKELTDGKGAELLVEPAHIARALFSVINLTQEQSVDLANGKKLEIDNEDSPLVAAIGPQERLVGLVSIKNGRTRVVTNFPVPVNEEVSQ